ncbi:MAG: right-handed parallel beta-helix repeat-containing protein [Methylococcaceae bacterium]
MFSTSIFAVDYELPNNQWRMISLPAEPPSGEDTVEKVFGDDLTVGLYGRDLGWVIYKFNTDINSYTPLKLGDSLEQGRGYWIIQQVKDVATLDMPAASTNTPASFSIKIASKTGTNTSQWTLSGSPFSSTNRLGDFFLKTDTSVCSDPLCHLDKAKTEERLLSDGVWSFIGGKYVLKNQEDMLEAWDGFWTSSLENSQDVKLSLQLEDGSPSRNIYVALPPKGHDSNIGSKESPYATITHASTQSEAGDIINIAAGVYSEFVEITKPGKPGKPILYVGETTGTYPNIEYKTIIHGGEVPQWWGGGEEPWGGLFNIENQKYINVSGIEIKKSKWVGFSIDKSHYIKIKKSKIDDTTSSGIYVVEGSSITIDENEVTKACNGGREEAISIVLSSVVQVSNNMVHNSGIGEPNTDGSGNGGEGIDIKAGSHDIKVFGNHVYDNPKIGIYVDAWDQPTFNIDVYNNQVHGIKANGIVVASERGGKVSNVSIYNNIVYDNDDTGITIGGRDWRDDKIIDPVTGKLTKPTPMEGINIINNTVYKNTKGGIYIANQDADKVVVRNNISSQNATPSDGQIEVSGTTRSINKVEIDHNLTYNNPPAGAKQIFIWDITTETGNDLLSHRNDDPFFVNPVIGDFHLDRSDSKAIDNGSLTEAPNKDYDRFFRPHGEGVDIGAFEYR